MGTIVLSDPIDACNPLSPLKHDWFTDSIPIIATKRGNCSFVTKANNVQLAGGKMLLIIDNMFEDVNNTILIGDGQRIQFFNFCIIFLFRLNYLDSFSHDRKCCWRKNSFLSSTSRKRTN